jgi:hypothetical protein
MNSKTVNKDGGKCIRVKKQGLRMDLGIAIP